MNPNISPDNNPNVRVPENRRDTNVHNLIILDESGSMHSMYRSALNGVNETLQTIRATQAENPEQHHYVTLVSFCSLYRIRYNEIYSATPAERTADITEGQYDPNGGTPLYDAMGRAITELGAKVKEGDVVLVTVITDGEENTSTEYSRSAIKALVEARRAAGWVFTYIGANQDVDRVADSMSIKHRMSFTSDEDGASAMFIKERNARMNFFKKINDTDLSCNSLDDDDYFAGV